MKKTAYIFCVCMLFALIVYQLFFTGTSDKSQYVATAILESRVNKENQQADKTETGQGEGEKEGEKKEETPKKVAYLSFDDGPSENTEKILATLKEKQAVATFFLVGKEITTQREETVKKILLQGSAVGVHTHCHEQNELYCNRESFFRDFEQAEKVIERVTGKKPTLYRFPWGSNNRYVSSYVDELHQELNQRGIKCFDWNVSGEDSVGRNISGDVIFRNIKKDLTKHEQPIILLHDSATMDNTAEVLGQIIDYIRSEGYSFATLEDREEYTFPASWRR